MEHGFPLGLNDVVELGHVVGFNDRAEVGRQIGIENGGQYSCFFPSVRYEEKGFNEGVTDGLLVGFNYGIELGLLVGLNDGSVSRGESNG